MSNVIIGEQHAVQQYGNYGYQVGRGSYQKLRWKLTTQADVDTLTTALAGAGYSWDVTKHDAVFDVEGRLDYESGGAPTSTPISTLWERDVQVTEKDVLESNLAIVGGISEDDKRTIRQYIDDTSSSPALSGDADTIYNLMLNGFKTWTVYQPIIRRSKLASNGYTVAESDTNVGEILTAAQMTSLEGAPGGILFALPASGAGARSDIALLVGYLKMPCRVQQQGDGRWLIQQEWHYGYWPSALYSAA